MTQSYLLGYDLGSSSVKAALISADNGQLIASASYPPVEMEIQSPQSGWAEQNPEIWWENVKIVTQQILKTAQINPNDILAIGISYQMHGLVVVNKNHQVLRPSIIWCDSRAVSIGQKALQSLGQEYALTHLLNSPGNFTASKLRWVQENEPQVYAQIHKMMLPGDYLAMRMTGEINTTISGLSEGILWDFQNQNLPDKLLQYYGIAQSLTADLVDTFSVQGLLTESAAKELGLAPRTKITYRAGDQPNNAFSLNVSEVGETATTAGTSGVIYGVCDKPLADKYSRVNTFVHVNHQKEKPRYGVLLCVNGTGILNSWLKKNLSGKSYAEMNELAAQVPIGAEGLTILPFGNGAERLLENRNIGASLHHLDLNRHSQAHLTRAVQEGIVFALGYGFKLFEEMGLKTQIIRAGDANMFLSPLFAEAFVNVTNCRLELYNTDGAQGAARGAGIGLGFYANFPEAFQGLKCLKVVEPEKDKQEQYQNAYAKWAEDLHTQMIDS
jgi:xylulokinase